MIESFFRYISAFDGYVWDYVAIPAILLLGIFLSVKARWFQIVNFKKITKLFFSLIFSKHDDHKRGIHPLKAFFASLGGCMGIGNIVVVCTAVQAGGPGTIFWMWIAAFIGMIVKYAEIYLGIKYRIKNHDASYDGGPMYYLQKITSNMWIPRIVCVLLCIYGTDMYMFRIVTHTLVSMWGLNHYLVIASLLFMIFYTTRQGIGGVGMIASITIPVFFLIFTCVSLFILISNIRLLPEMFALIFKSAFTGHAAVGGFAGSSVLMTMSHGFKRACYASDIGIGYAAVINSETEEANPAKQASLSIFGIFLDTFVICTMSVLLILVTGLWNQGIHEGHVIALAIEEYISFTYILWPAFIFLLGYSNMIAIFSVGEKAAAFLSPRYGKSLYACYGIIIFLLFSFVGSERQLLTIMSMAGVLLLLINLWGILMLYKKITFTLSEEE